ncbi:MAG: transposase, partial [Candidatus Dormibacteraceae bacterium]
MDYTPSVVHRTTRSWLHEEVERVVRRCCEQVLAETPVAPTGGRPAELPDLSLWMAVIVVVLRGLWSQRAIWRLLVGGGLWTEACYDICDQTVYSRLARHGSGPLPALFVRLTELLRQWQARSLESYEQHSGTLAPFAREVVAIDESTLDAVCRRVRPLRQVPDGDARLLPGKLVGAFDVRLQLWRAMHYVEQVTDNEKEHALDMLACLAPGTLLLFDLGYFSFAWFDALTKGNYPWVTRLRELTTMVVMHTYYDDGSNWDKLVWLGIWDTQGAYLVRAVQVTYAGVTHRYVTNVLNPVVLPMGDLVGLYARRWDIERAFLLLKEWLGLRQLWSSKPQVILAQVWACLIVAQVIQSIRVQMAVVAGVEVADISLPMLMQALGQWNTSGEEGWREMVEQCRRTGIIRPHSCRDWQAPEIPSSAYRPLPAIRTLVRPGLYPDQRS